LLIALRFAEFACGPTFESEDLYSTWSTALPAMMKYVVSPLH